MAKLLRIFGKKTGTSRLLPLVKDSYLKAEPLNICYCRSIRSSSTSSSGEKSSTVVNKEKPSEGQRKAPIDDEVYSPLQQYRPSDFEKRILVWTKYYPSVDDVPDKVTRTKMKRAYDWMRIRVSIGMMIASIIIGMGFIYSGRKARLSGDGITKRGIEYGKKMREIGIREEEEARAAAEKKKQDAVT